MRGCKIVDVVGVASEIVYVASENVGNLSEKVGKCQKMSNVVVDCSGGPS